MLFCVSGVDKDLIFHENFIGVYKMEKSDVASMIAVIKNILLRLGLDGAKLRSQCYNGCSTMMGKKKGVATQN